MKVLIVTPYFTPHTGGVESYSLNMAKQLQALGWEVVVVTSSLPDTPETETLEGIKIYRLQKTLTISNTPVGWRWRAQLKKIYAIERPDVINGHVPVPYLADVAERARGRIPFVLTYHNDLAKSTFLLNLITGVLNRTVVRRTLRRSDRIIATSQYYADTSSLLRQYANKLDVVAPGVDTTLFNPKVKASELQKKYPNEQIILFVGSIERSQQHKGLDTLIQSFAGLQSKKQFQDTRLVVIGSGDGRAMYRRLARKMGVADRVEFTGRIANELLAQYYKRASMLVMPSRDRNEGFGMVFMEASAVGIPVIGTKVGGIPYAILDKETGLVVAPDNTKALQRAMATILTDPTLAHRLGVQGAKRAAAEFDWKLLSQKTAKILENATKPTVIQVAGYYPPSLGGMERVAEALSEKLAEQDYEVEVLTSNVNQPAQPETPKSKNLRIRRFWAFEFAHTAFAPGFIPAIFRVPKRSVLHLHLSQAFYPEWTLLVAKLRRLPYVVHFHLDLEPSGPLGAVFVIYKAVIIRAVISNANAVIVFSSEQQQFIHDKYGVPMNRIYIIPNGVGDEYFKEPKKRLPNQLPMLLYVGRISPQKRVNFLTEALALMHVPARLTIVGDGEDRAVVEAGIPKDKVASIQFTGRLSPAETLAYFGTATAFVMASSVEGMPLAILEAMASGLPIVGADVSGIKELVGGVGILVKNPSAATFARSLDDLLTQPALLLELSQKSYESAKKYSWSALIDRLLVVYKEVLS